ncbi:MULTISPECIES: tRNA (adenosine(37)-N6)-dimethylallyltransferase MiaA [Rhizobium]|uniref:tRNA (adenosine(37)-N6)-dimethylallyltransferase MiaA n=1 Tax=Rhizobium TaxID=379 RepID=UPI0015CF0FD7|nr:MULTISPECIES: tRNA (adenosine(37)-N6)-dimethylallyltransferase MiaA [Rhizobium]MBY4593162.1 tRNA (adenosine(37)-N6)-dimethylallyltransferase MiaA [Rhizobium redzepovicii]MBY4617705.1 tRNA (adenosine(37)-N6)-dimethylallyltransferase MiaA [Rhizobium redzepovicii]MDF0659445.1 tRNA (adenosine(37)-N6)-dimethylallyltransferase MiaA [Rhizobium sp. BC49]ULJ79330.1 tRNA (adenosine(37)-N6)-dimethylallyltransferase MiaA [Rhizobium sp. C104]
MMENLLSTVNAILITGPTASGKSALAVELAKRHDGAVVNADSMQVYDTLRVLTARPSKEEMQGVPHHLYGHVPAGAGYSTGTWLRDVSALLPALRAAGRLPVFVGGTGLYFKALTGGLSDMPEIPEALREELRARLLEEGPEGLHAELAEADPAMAASFNRQDGQRIVRALEVFKATGRSIADFQGRSGPVVIDAAQARKIVVLPDRAVLHQRINGRFEKMLDQGAEGEVRALLALDLPAEAPVMKAIGVSQIAAMLKGGMTRDEVLEKGAAATRQYAKRQMTWFRNQMDDSWERLTA